MPIRVVATTQTSLSTGSTGLELCSFQVDQACRVHDHGDGRQLVQQGPGDGPQDTWDGESDRNSQHSQRERELLPDGRRALRDSSNRCGSLARSSESSAISAVSMATSVPPSPMAIPTRITRRTSSSWVGVGLMPIASWARRMAIFPADAFGIDMALKAAPAARPRLVVIDESPWLKRECFFMPTSTLRTTTLPGGRLCSADARGSRGGVGRGRRRPEVVGIILTG